MQEVSVIIPNFNGMAYLDGVLSGLECQTVRNFEVILVDNGSSDGSCAFVAYRRILASAKQSTKESKRPEPLMCCS